MHVNDQEDMFIPGDLVPTLPATGRHDLADDGRAVLETLLPRGKKARRPPRGGGRRQLLDEIRWQVLVTADSCTPTRRRGQEGRRRAEGVAQRNTCFTRSPNATGRVQVSPSKVSVWI
jgi:hypothetical protein